MRILLLLGALLWAPLAKAEVVSSSASAFVVQAEAEVAAPPDRVWRDLARIERWWSPAHTFSGDASRLSLSPRAGGCFCERWENGQSVEHARVVMVMNYQGAWTLRAAGALGPLQAMGANGVLTFTVAPHASGTKLSMSYRVSGDPSLALDQLAPIVDGVLMEQFGRLSRYAASGTPN
ncbi:MAG: hypothetical protein R3C25_03985 [Hyphomonadaceae bacterium]